MPVPTTNSLVSAIISAMTPKNDRPKATYHQRGVRRSTTELI